MADYRTRAKLPLCGGPGLELLGFSFVPGASPGTIRDGGGNLIASVTSPAAGRYVVTFNKPRPRQLVCPMATVTQPAGTVNKAHANVLNNYDAAAGTFEIQTVVDDGTPAVEHPVANSRVNFMALVQTVNQLVQS
jgi:hypothetical protein